jgi:SAM-dependent methyltransferase
MKKNQRDYQDLFDIVEKNLDLTEPELVAWNKNYFLNQKDRYENDLRLVDRYYQSGEILEIGSSPCHLTICLKYLGYPVKGIDVSPERFHKLIEKHDLEIIKCDIEREPIPFDDNTFGLILFNEVFEHLRIDPIYTLQELNRVLAPKGTMVLTTPNLYFGATIVRFFLGRSFNNAFKEFEKLRTLGHMGHIREYSRREIYDFLAYTRFIVKEFSYKTYSSSVQVFLSKRFGIKSIPFLSTFLYIIPKWWRPFLVFVVEKC